MSLPHRDDAPGWTRGGTAALGPEQQELALELIRRVADSGKAVVIISHSLQHVLSVTDRIAVLRRGELVALVRGGETTGDELVSYITGTRAQEPSSFAA